MYNSIYLLNILHFLNDGMRTMIITLLPFLTKTFDLSLTQVGFIGASQGVMAVISALPGGLLAAKLGGIRFLFLLMNIYTVSMYLIGLTSLIPLIIVAYYIAAIGFAPFHLVGQALTARISTKFNLGTNMSNFTLVGESGRIMIPAIALYFAAQNGWNNTIIFAAIINSILFFICYLLWKKNKNVKSVAFSTKKETNRDWIKQFIYLLKQKKLLYVSLTGFLDNLGGNAIYVFLPFLLLARGIETEQLALYMTAFFIGTFTGKVILGRAVDIFGNVKVLYFAEIVMALFLLLLTIITNPLFFIVINLGLGIFTRGTTPVIATLYANSSHENHYEKVFAISELFQGTSAALSPILLGFIGTSYGINASFYTSTVLVFLVLIPLTMYTKSR